MATDALSAALTHSAVMLRAHLFHTPRDPFTEAGAVDAHADGALAMADGRIVASGNFADVRRGYPTAPVEDLRPCVLLPGFVDAHVHAPQLPVVGRMGRPLLAWLRDITLPEEARFADLAYARVSFRAFVRLLLRRPMRRDSPW